MPPLPLIAGVPLAIRRAALVALRLLVGGVFLLAAIPKLADPATFAADVDHYHLLPAALVGPFALALPVLEALVALALISGVHARGAALLAIAMLACFAGAMGQALVRGIDLDCGCFGAVARTEVGVTSIARNLLLALACVPIVRASRKSPSLAPGGPTP